MNGTEICNLALSYLGQGRIMSLEDATEEARKCKVHYDHDRRRMLMAYPWGFARRIEKLACYDERVPGWDALYAYPAECVGVLYVYDAAGAQKKETAPEDYEVLTFGGGRRAIATNVRDAWAEFTADVRDGGLFSEEFVEGLAHLLASSIAMGVTGNEGTALQQMQLAQQALMFAGLYNAREKEKRMQYPERYANERFTS